jgi:uncharacterized protein
MAMFAMITTYGPDTDLRLATRPAHREYLKTLIASGNLLHAGPFADDLGALVVFEADSQEQVEGFLAGDPYTKAGVLENAVIREWNRVLP